MRKQTTDVQSSPFNALARVLLLAGILVAVLLAILSLDVAVDPLSADIAFGEPVQLVSAPLQPATSTATMTLTPTATMTAVASPTATTTATPVTSPTATMTMPPVTSPTATLTMTPVTTATATATSTPTDVPSIPTATLTPEPPPTGRDILTARVFVDFRCDSFFFTGVDIPLSGVPVTLMFPGGASATIETNMLGLAYFSGFDASGGVTVSVDLPDSYRGYQLGNCPSSPTSMELEADEFQFGYKFVSFGAAVTGELAGP